MKIELNTESVVDSRTGEISAPSEYLSNLRAIECAIQRADEEVTAHKASLKRVRDAREELVIQLRAAVREGKVLPLLELAEDRENDGFAYTPGWDDVDDDKKPETGDTGE